MISDLVRILLFTLLRSALTAVIGGSGCCHLAGVPIQSRQLCATSLSETSTYLTPVHFQRQQSGRAGRRSRDSLSVLVSDSLPADRHFVANPDDIFDKVRYLAQSFWQPTAQLRGFALYMDGF